MELSSHQTNEIFKKVAALPLLAYFTLAIFKLFRNIFLGYSSLVTIMCNFTKAFNFTRVKDTAEKKRVFYI